MVLLVSLSVVSAAIGFGQHALRLNENQVLYLFSTSSQVIAAVYGLTLTGFIFFRNELSREEFEDETLTEAVETLKQRYLALLMFITILVILTILAANLAISLEAGEGPGRSVLVINLGQSAFVTSLAAIAYFMFDVLSPHSIEIASRTLQDKVDPTRTQRTEGGLEEFLRNYNQIELLLVEAGQAFQTPAAASPAKGSPRRISNARLAEMLFRAERIRKDLFRRIRELNTLRNSIIHGAEPVVSEELVQMSREVLQELRVALNPDSR